MSAIDTTDLGDIEEVTFERASRARKPYKTATQRPATLSEALANEESLFGDETFGLDDYPSLNDLYITMEELNKIKGTNGLKAVSLFSGCAGSGTGFAWAGWQELMAVEFVKAARETIAANYPSSMVEPDDVTKIVRKFMDKYEGKLTVEFTKPRKLKGVEHKPIINWEATFSNVAKMIQESEEEHGIANPEAKQILDDLMQMRYEVSKKALKKAYDEDKMLLWGDDIRGLDPQAILDVFGLKKGELDCLEGSPPCKSFSMSGVREGGWGQVLHYSDERDQRTDDLFLEYVRILKALMPKTFIAENVAGMTMGAAATDVMAPLIREFDKMGYRVEARVLNSSQHGVPQTRPRVFFIGIRKDLINKRTGVPSVPRFPERASHTYTLRDALEAAGQSPKHELEHVDIDKGGRYEAGKIWHSLPIGGAPENKAYQFMRCHPDLPVPTITATSAGNQPSAGPTHPYECRKFTVHEMRYLFGFPKDYVFTGTLDQQGERMGRSVTPYLMKQLSEGIAAIIKESELVGTENIPGLGGE